MPIRIKHFAIPVSIVAGVGAALVTSAVAQSGGPRTTLTAPPFGQSGTVLPLSALLNGDDEAKGTNPIGDVNAFGSVLITVNTATNQVCGNLESTTVGPFIMFHIHIGDQTVRNGDVVVDFAPPAGQTAPYHNCVIDSDAAAIAANPSGYYVNVHTTAHPTGAMSGQLAFRSPTTMDTQETHLLGTPFRAYDTRFNGAGKFTPGTTRPIDLTASGIPVGARAAIVTVTVTRADNAGFLTVYSNALAEAPNTSNVNFTANEDIANNITVATDGNNMIKITSGAAATTPGAVGSNEDVIVDVVGYVL